MRGAISKWLILSFFHSNQLGMRRDHELQANVHRFSELRQWLWCSRCKTIPSTDPHHAVPSYTVTR